MHSDAAQYAARGATMSMATLGAARFLSAAVGTISSDECCMRRAVAFPAFLSEAAEG